VEVDGTIRLGLRYVSGLRKEVGQAIESAQSQPPTLVCPKCGCDDPSMLERIEDVTGSRGFCSTCAHDWALY